jgi:uncharacterized protein YkwD
VFRLAFLLLLAALPALPHARTPDLPAVEARVLELTNAFRASEGRAALVPERHLRGAAREFARYMATTGRYGHEADGREPAERARSHGYDYCMVSENISFQFSSVGFGTGELAARLVEGWKKSPGHRRNMLEQGARHVGVAVAHSASSGRYYAVQVFGRPRSEQARFSIRNEGREPVRYRLGDEAHTLGARETHTHERCSREALRLEGEARGRPPRDGDAFVVRGGRLERQ